MHEELELAYETVICNELGEVVARCSEMTDEETQKMLDEHEEYYLNCVEV